MYEVVAHQCEYGLETRGVEKGTMGKVKKPTRFLTNSWGIAQILQNKCSGDHQHVALMSGRAEKAAEYPEALRRAMLDGV